MGERKVLNKYIPPDFDPALVPRGTKLSAKDGTVDVRMMLPFTLQCDNCHTFLYRGRKFNSKKEPMGGGTAGKYLGITRWRFYIKCTHCSRPVTFLTDPQNADYELESGGTRNYEMKKDQADTVAAYQAAQDHVASVNPMAALESRVVESKKEMADLDNLEEIRAMNARHVKLLQHGGVTTPTTTTTMMMSMLSSSSSSVHEQDQQQQLTAEDEALVQSIFHSNNTNSNNNHHESNHPEQGPKRRRRLNDDDERMLDEARQQRLRELQERSASLTMTTSTLSSSSTTTTTTTTQLPKKIGGTSTTNNIVVLAKRLRQHRSLPPSVPPLPPPRPTTAPVLQPNVGEPGGAGEDTLTKKEGGMLLSSLLGGYDSSSSSSSSHAGSD